MLIILLVFILGLAIGSAINALVWRLREGKSWVKGHSICPKCKHKLGWLDLIPIVSFLILKGRCRYCKKKISIEYPLVELATGIIFVLIYFSIIDCQADLKQQIAILILNFFIAAILIIIFVYDLKHYLILDKVILPAIVVVFVANIFLGKSWLEMLVSGLIVSGFFLIQFLISKGRWIGGGDLRLGFFMGIILGWPHVLVALFLAYVLGSVIGIMLIVFKIKKWHSKIPFATFLCPATLVAMLWSEQLLDWYFNVLLR